MAVSGSAKMRIRLPAETVARSYRDVVYQELKDGGVKRLLEIEPGPLPPAQIIERTGVMHDTEAEVAEQRRTFWVSGYYHLREILDATRRCGLDLNNLDAVFELGCGAARVIRHFRAMPEVRLIASDIGATSIRWCQANIPGVEFHVNQPTPPLEFAEDESFDVAIAMSVFTHIPLNWQSLWLHEISRILRRGGFLVATVAGEHHRRLQLRGKPLECFRRHGHVTLSPRDPGVSVSTRLTNTWDVFQTKGELYKVFGDVFKILSHLEDQYGLDTLVLQKPR